MPQRPTVPEFEEVQMDLAHALDTVGIAEAVSTGGEEVGDDAQRRLESRVGELDETISVLLESGEPAAALRLVGSLSRFCQDRGFVDLGRELAERTLRIADDHGTGRQRAAAWLTFGELTFRQGGVEIARDADPRSAWPARSARAPFQPVSGNRSNAATGGLTVRDTPEPASWRICSSKSAVGVP